MPAIGLQVQAQSTPLEQVMDSFTTVDLSTLKDKAELMERRDNKYVLTTDQVLAFLEHAQSQFDMLEIGGLRQFHYLSHYYDSAELITHSDHNKGRRRRVKIRHRHYVDSGEHYFEIKLKGRRKLTQKSRIPFNPNDLDENNLNDELIDYYSTVLTAYYGSEDERNWWLVNLVRSISVGYHRITLVSKTRNCRITMDNSIYFTAAKTLLPESQETSTFLNQDKWVIEVKSPSGRTDIERWLFQNKSRPVSLCSKYAMGVNLLKLDKINNRFSEVIRRHFECCMLFN